MSHSLHDSEDLVIWYEMDTILSSFNWASIAKKLHARGYFCNDAGQFSTMPGFAVSAGIDKMRCVPSSFKRDIKWSI